MDSSERNDYMIRMTVIGFADAVTIAFSYLVALWARFDFQLERVPEMFKAATFRFIPAAILLSIVVYYFLHLYHAIWRYASVTEVYRIAAAYSILAVLFILLNMTSFFWIPRSVLLIGYMFSLVCCCGIRFGYRVLRSILFSSARRRTVTQENIMLIGAGSAGREVLKDLKSKRKYQVKCIVDDNSMTWGRYLEGVRIAGGRKDIPDLAEKYQIDTIVYAIPSAHRKDTADILNICKETGCKLQTIPGLAQIVSGEVSVSQLRDVSIEDLLGRDEIKVNNEEIMEAIRGKIVMVTGGGGSIGSELCRQIAKASPGQLIVFDIYENNAYDIEQELKKKHPELDLKVLVGSVRNTNRVNSILQKYHPDIIFHAAAHKHVPLMESSPCEAVKNNVMGTYKLATAAANAGVKRFLLISTDKAVNPTNVMGATKRLCEMIVQMMSRKHPETVFMAVRFGNVLGSNGSVIPLFKKQIAEGGPVTVTDPNIIRYFMTIPEAVSLVLQASYYAKGGEIFVLDMGKPVRIDDMARNLIKLSGFRPDVDIDIVYTGLRPGEKLFEELLMDEEGMQKTDNDLIYIGHPIEMDDVAFEESLKRLDQESRGESEKMKEIVAEIVPTYHPSKA